jgi:hypothetical protein
LKESFKVIPGKNVIPAKAGIQLSAFTFRMALKRFTWCPASAAINDGSFSVKSISLDLIKLTTYNSSKRQRAPILSKLKSKKTYNV